MIYESWQKKNQNNPIIIKYNVHISTQNEDWNKNTTMLRYRV